MNDKRCGTCKHWRPSNNCEYPIPEWLNVVVHRLERFVLPCNPVGMFPTVMHENEGTECPTHEA